MSYACIDSLTFDWDYLLNVRQSETKQDLDRNCTV